MPMPHTLLQLRGIPGTKYIHLGFFASKLLNHAFVHLCRWNGNAAGARFPLGGSSPGLLRFIKR